MGCCSAKSKHKNTDGNFEKKNDKVNSIQPHVANKELVRNYKINAKSKILGSGQFGKVFLSESVQDPNFKVAIKVINKDKLKESIDAIKEEVRILTSLDHSNIVKYYETYEDNKYMYLVMEYCPVGELF